MSQNARDEENDWRAFIHEELATFVKVAGRALYLIGAVSVALVALWFGVLFAIGGTAQVKCSYGRLSTIFTDHLPDQKFERFCPGRREG